MLTLSTSARAVDLKPKNFSLNVLGVAVQIPVTISFGVQSEGDGLALQVQAKGNLKDVQDKALAIARALPEPTDNCSRNGINPVVNSVDDASITPAGKSAVVTISGHVTAWACGHPLGATVKTVVGSDTVTISAPLVIRVINRDEVSMQLAGAVTVTPQHALTAEAVELLGGDLNSIVSTALTKALDASAAKASLPPLPGLNLNIQDAEFFGDGTALMVNANGSAHMTNDAFNALFQLMSQ